MLHLVIILKICIVYVILSTLCTELYSFRGFSPGNRYTALHSFDKAKRHSKTKANKPKTPFQPKRLTSAIPRSAEELSRPVSTSDGVYEEADPQLNTQTKNFAEQTITGQNIIDCRDFKLDSSKSFKFEGSFDDPSAVPIFGLPEIAFIGRSNVGKSSLLNMLTGLKDNIAVVSKTPGRTRLINVFKCSDREGDICLFVDLPGYGYAKVSKEEQIKISDFLTSYLGNRGPLQLVIVLVDIRREPLDSDRDIIEYMKDQGIPFVVVATKCDKLSPQQTVESLEVLNQEYDLPPGYPVISSAVNGVGKKDIWRVIKGGVVGDLFVTDPEEKES